MLDSSSVSAQPARSELGSARHTFILALVETCVRNSFLEDLHAGTFPGSETGDFRDVKVVTPYGEIPWPELSRVSDIEMKRLMIEVVNRVYTFLSAPEDLMTLGAARRWDMPRLDEKLSRTVQRRAAVRSGMSMDEALERYPPFEDDAGTDNKAADGEDTGRPLL